MRPHTALAYTPLDGSFVRAATKEPVSALHRPLGPNASCFDRLDPLPCVPLPPAVTRSHRRA